MGGKDKNWRQLSYWYKFLRIKTVVCFVIVVTSFILAIWGVPKINTSIKNISTSIQSQITMEDNTQKNSPTIKVTGSSNFEIQNNINNIIKKKEVIQKSEEKLIKNENNNNFVKKNQSLFELAEQGLNLRLYDNNIAFDVNFIYVFNIFGSGIENVLAKLNIKDRPYFLYFDKLDIEANKKIAGVCALDYSFCYFSNEFEPTDEKIKNVAYFFEMGDEESILYSAECRYVD